MESKRDPRVYPKSGDVLCAGGERREVVAVNPAQFLRGGREFEATITFMYSRGIALVDFDRWRKWAKDAESESEEGR